VVAPLHCQLRNNRLAIFNNRDAKKQSTNFKFMYALKNKVQLIGNLGNAPEVRNTETGKKLARFSMATNEQYKNSKGERVTETQWHNVIAWGNVAEIAEKYLKKGAEVAVEGKLVNRSYVDKEGAKRTITEIQVTEILMLSKATAPMVA
jgi:single-strand DNA-binding protein